MYMVRRIGGRIGSLDRSGNIDGTQEQPMGADARIRPGTLDDNLACAAVLVEAINDLGRRNGSIDDGSALDLEVEWPRWRPFFEHIGRTAAEFLGRGGSRWPPHRLRAIDRPRRDVRAD